MRPLFAPTEDELRALDRERLETERSEQRAAESAFREEQEAGLRRLMSRWRAEPSAGEAAEILERAALLGEAGLFAEVAAEILKASVERAAGVPSPVEAAALVESHSRLLPQEERGSGALFWLREEIAKIRSEG